MACVTRPARQALRRRGRDRVSVSWQFVTVRSGFRLPVSSFGELCAQYDAG